MSDSKSVESIDLNELEIIYCKKDISLNSYDVIEGKLVLDVEKIQVVFSIIVEYKNDRYQAFLESGKGRDLKDEFYKYIDEDEYVDIGGTCSCDFSNISYGETFGKIDFIHLLKSEILK